MKDFFTQRYFYQMEKLIIDYSMGSDAVSNPDGSFAAVVQNCTVSDATGDTVLGTFDASLDFSGNGSVQATIPPNTVSPKQFCVRVLFNATTAITSRQNLVECTSLPFAIFLDKGANPNEYTPMVSINNASLGWIVADNKDKPLTLKINEWHVIDLVFDNDTLGLLVDGKVVSVVALPKGALQAGTGDKLFVGTWVNGTSFQFKGKIAAVKLYEDIPAALESLVDDRRTSAEWFISHKYNALRPALNLGGKIGGINFDASTSTSTQNYQHGLIMYTEGYGVAFEMHGVIWERYKSDASVRINIGTLISDEINAARPGAKKSLFTKGGIYWSGQTGAVAVMGYIYLKYEHFKESAHPIGLPKAGVVDISGGEMQEFQFGRMYYRQGAASAFEVHGAILQKYIEKGAHTAWGFPVTDEMDAKKNGANAGKFSQFEAGTIYWSSGTGAHLTYGSIRDTYENMGGPSSGLGFPTSSEEDIPNLTGPGRYNTFQNGSILWFGNQTIVCHPFTIFIGRVDTVESEGLGAGQNDVYMHLSLKDNGNEFYRRRLPESGDFGGRNIVDVNHRTSTITPNSPNKKISIELDIWDSDGFLTGDDDHLGVFRKELNMANAWGLRERADGVFNSGKFSNVNNINWAVQPVVPASAPKDFWGVVNRGTPELSWQQYASAFRDVDSETEWWDITDGLQAIFYEAVVKGIASGGNCFGMSTQAIYGWKNTGIFGRPLSRFTDWNTVKNEFNLKQAYQVGAAPMWWFVGEFLTGNTHSPKNVFEETRNAFNRGENPVLCISQNADFSGAPHCILPFEWDSSSKPWKIKIFDPNKQNNVQTMTINPDANTYAYNNGKAYSGGEWSGGRLHYMPWCVLSEAPRTPLWEAILLLLAGTVLILGEDAETVSLTDLNGNDLNALNDTSKQASRLKNKFVHYKGFDGDGIIGGEMFFRKQASFRRRTPVVPDFNVGSIGTASGVRINLPNTATFESPSIELSTSVLGSMRLPEFLLQAGNDFIHTIRAKKNGQFKYSFKHKLSDFQLINQAIKAEVSKIEIKNVGTPTNITQLNSTRDKTTQLISTSKLGIGSDEIKVTIDQIPVKGGVPLSMNIQSGLGAIDLITAGEPINARVKVETKINGRNTVQNFDTQIEGNTRLVFSQALSTESIKVGKIDSILGGLVSSKTLKKQ
jgi:hypothetical protein